MGTLKIFITKARTVSGAIFTILKTVSTLKGDLIRYDGTVSCNGEESPASWNSNGELISLDGIFPLDDDRRAYQLVLIEDL